VVDEIQTQYQLPAPARILSASALQVWATGMGEANATGAFVIEIN
jgi:hypothetical protein